MWRHLGVMGHVGHQDRLAVLNLLLFAVALTDGHCCPRRPPDFVNRTVEESIVTPGHLDLWMKDLSPDDSWVRRSEGVIPLALWVEVSIGRIFQQVQAQKN